jgi:hypothetical protein
MLLFVLLAGCQESPDKTDLAGKPSGTTDSGSNTTDDPTWHADVQPLLATNCTRCHTEGGLGPGNFTDLATVKALAPAMLGAMEAGEMPPPASDPSCQDYEGSEHLNLSDDALDLLTAWVDADMPEGEATTAPPSIEIKDQLENPDTVVMMEAPYTPTFTDANNPGNEYRCFALDAGDLAGRSINAMAPILGNNQMVHHIVLFSLPTDSLTDEMQDPGGWDCIDNAGVASIDGMISAWAPGMLPIEFPEGTGLAVDEGQSIVIQMHYFYNGAEDVPESDQSGYAFHLAPEEGPVVPVLMAPIGDYSFVIPAGDAAHSSTDQFTNSYVPLKVLGIFPHMHDLGSWFNAKVVHSDGTETCLVDGAYSFDNQMTYQFKDSVPLNVGDSVEFTCTWDNSEGTEEVRWGERTNEEMCFFFSFVTL